MEKTEKLYRIILLISLISLIPSCLSLLFGFAIVEALNTKGTIILISSLVVVIALLIFLLEKRKYRKRRMLEKEEICILSLKHFRKVMKTVPGFVQFTYDYEYFRPAYYQEGFFGEKVEGYIVIGFKMDWPKNNKKTGNELLDALTGAPTISIFIHKEQLKTLFLLTHACVVEVNATIDARCIEKPNIPLSCSLVSNLGRGLNEKEISRIRAVNAFLARDC